MLGFIKGLRCTLGSKDPLYLSRSGRTARDFQDMCVEAVKIDSPASVYLSELDYVYMYFF